MFPRLFAAPLLVFGCCTASLHAQSNDAKEPVGSIRILTVKEGQYRYEIKNAEGTILMIPPASLSWGKVADVRKVIQELTLTISKTLVEDPESHEEFKNREFRYSFRVKNSKGAIVAIPPEEMQWQTKAELAQAVADVKAVLQTATTIEVAGRPELRTKELINFRGAK